MTLDETIKWLNIVYREAETTEEYLACVKQQGLYHAVLKREEKK